MTVRKTPCALWLPALLVAGIWCAPAQTGESTTGEPAAPPAADELMTADPIPGAGTTDLPSKYVWVDESIDPARAYYYYVESISMSGHREHFTPIIKAPAKTPEDPDAADKKKSAEENADATRP